MLKDGLMNIEFASLVALASQNAVCTVLVRHSRTRKKDLFISSTAVVLSEVVKLHMSLFFVYATEVHRKPSVSFLGLLQSTTIQRPMEMLKLCVPSILYALQNNLFFVASTYLDATSLQVTYQLRILTTAFFTVLILRKSLKRNQWFSLVILSVGVAQIQIADAEEGGVTGPANRSPFIGTLAALSACFISSFAGVYFEKMLKDADDISLWMRNVQLSAIAIPASLAMALIGDWDELNARGFFYGYDSFVVLVVLMQASGGLLVAVVIKYTDNIRRGFATSFAIILSCVISMYFFDFHLTWEFALGAVSVMISVFLYQMPLSELPGDESSELLEKCEKGGTVRTTSKKS